MSISKCCFLTCIHVSQKADKMFRYSYLCKNFLQFAVTHIVKGFGVVNKAEVDVFLELSCFFNDSMDVGNLISGFSAFSKSTLNIWKFLVSDQIRSDQSLSHVQLFATPWITAHQASLSITNSRSSLRLTSIKSVMPSSHLILCRPLLLLPPIPSSIRVFSNESTLRMRWPKYWSFSFSISVLSMNTQDWSPLEWTDWISLQSKGLSRVFFNTTVQKHQFFSAQPSSQSNSHIHTWPQEKP